MPVACEHGAEYHDGTVSSVASAPEASRAWLLVEHPGPWPAEPIEAELPGRLHDMVTAADELGIRVQLIRRPGRRSQREPDRPVTVFAGWTAGEEPWLRRGAISAGVAAGDLDLAAVAAGRQPSFGGPAAEQVYLVCTHARRNACCGRFGLPLAQALARRYPAQVWETSHVGGHKFAANLVLLPRGLYYGPVQLDGAVAAIEAYRSGGAIVAAHYRGRAGQTRDEQAAEYALLTRAASAT